MELAKHSLAMSLISLFISDKNNDGRARFLQFLNSKRPLWIMNFISAYSVVAGTMMLPS